MSQNKICTNRQHWFQWTLNLKMREKEIEWEHKDGRKIMNGGELEIGLDPNTLYACTNIK